MDIANLTVNNIFAILLVLCRVGSILMVLPGVGDSYISVRHRLILALAISFVIYPLLILPDFPPSAFILLKLLVIEIVIGIFIGLIIKMQLAVIHVVGAVISSQSGLGSAMLFDPSQNTQSAIVSSFLSLLTITLIFSSDLHHVFIRGFTDSYDLFAAGENIALGDFTDYFLDIVREIFIVSIKIMSPQIVVGLLLLVGAGILSKLMPALHIFFLITPVQLLVSFAILMLTLSVTMIWYMDYLGDVATSFLIFN
ncbi:flagellar biosynthesis protein FliR [Candidatus Arcanobacter lacustris]|uniref:Flagellar biosynthesis protein FliR n=1 Tax=Candidatus Arcanibacter lacustris TaxID=1607817 RepID=A0A0F5MNN4_9RICK|nr:flagellar biosynthesis protein FliR [Candidatus Arcanobacter lacustris]